MEDFVDNATQESQMLIALSPKEMQVLSWMARGFTNNTIADVLSRDTKAVERQVSNIYSKLHLSDEGKDAHGGGTLPREHSPFLLGFRMRGKGRRVKGFSVRT